MLRTRIQWAALALAAVLGSGLLCADDVSPWAVAPPPPKSLAPTTASTIPAAQPLSTRSQDASRPLADAAPPVATDRPVDTHRMPTALPPGGATDVPAPIPDLRPSERLPGGQSTDGRPGSGPVVSPTIDGRRPVAQSFIADPLPGGQSTLEPGVVGFKPTAFERTLTDELPGYYVSADFLYLRRTTTEETTLALQQLPGPTLSELTSRDFDFDYKPGLRLTFGYPIGYGRYAETSIFGMDQYRSSSFVSGGSLSHSFTGFPFATDVSTPLGFPTPSFASQAIDYTSRIYGGESNLKFALTVFPNTFFLVGVRGIDLTENLGVTEAGGLAATVLTPAQVAAGVPTPPLAPAVGAQSFRVDNRLIGGQVGYEAHYLGKRARFSLDSIVKIGGFFNLTSLRTAEVLSNSPNGPLIATSRDDHTTGSFMVEATVGATYHLRPNVSIRGGFETLYLTSIALAPQQRAPNLFNGNSFGVDTSDRAVYFGPYAGVEITWGCSAR